MSSFSIFVLSLLGIITAAAWVPSVNFPSQRPRQGIMSRTATSIIMFDNQSRHDQQADFMEMGQGSVVGDMPDLTEDLALVRTIAKAGDGRKAEDIIAVQVAHVSTLTSFMIFLSGNSRPQNQAIVAAIADEVEDTFGLVRNPQGTADSGWMVLDYGSVMVHVMTPKSRLFYNVEGQWREKGGITVDLGDVLLPNKPDFASVTMEGLSEEDDPFWG